MDQPNASDRETPETPAMWDHEARLDENAAETKVLARMPDLNNPASCDLDRKPRSARADGRILGQRISAKLLVGGAALLVLAAVVPWWLGKDRTPEGGRPPAPDADLAPAFNPADTARSELPPSLPEMPYGPAMSITPEIPPIPSGPEFTNPAAGGTNDAAWQPGPRIRSVSPVPSEAQTTVPGGQAAASNWNQVPRQPPLLNVPSHPASSSAADVPMLPGAPNVQTRYGGRFDAGQPDPAYYGPSGQPQANRNRPDVNTNRPMTIYERYPGTTGAYQTDYRSNDPLPPQADSRTDYRTYYQADSRADPGRAYRSDPVQPPRQAEPGVARFEGTIEQPSVRTTHERTGSGVY